MAHARRGFVKALESGNDRAIPFLAFIGGLYRIEAEDFSTIDRPALRRQRSIPFLLQLQHRLLHAFSDSAILAQSALGNAGAIPIAVDLQSRSKWTLRPPFVNS